MDYILISKIKKITNLKYNGTIKRKPIIKNVEHP